MRSLIFAVLFAFAAVPALAQENERPVQAETKQAEAQPEAAAKADTKEYLPPPGWKTRHRGNKMIYCRKDTEIGSRFPVDKCFSKEQLDIELARIEMSKEEFDRRRRVCSDQSICGGS